MYISKLDISGIGGIKELSLHFSKKFNVICGANGIGKTTILNIIADAFSYDQSQIKKNAQYNIGKYQLSYHSNKETYNIDRIVSKFSPIEKEYSDLYNNESKNILRFGANRSFNYIPLDGLKPDPVRDTLKNSSIISFGVSVEDVKNWFINRYAFHDKEGSLSKEELENFNIAKKMFSVLDSSVYFKTVLGKSYDIILSTSNGDIYFEYLSAGYKSCIYIIMGIMKEIEYRYADSPINIEGFSGCILIDEIEEHLHPTWQAQLVNALKTVFPNAQFIVTTHSPSILQVMETDEIIPLYLNEKNETSVKDLALGEYGLKGWTLEEILKHVMGMPETTSQLYKDTINAFDKALYEENIPEIKRNYEILDQMLHSESTLRKLLQIQMVGLEE